MQIITDFSNLKPVGKILVIIGIIGIGIIVYFIVRDLKKEKKEEKTDGDTPI